MKIDSDIVQTFRRVLLKERPVRPLPHAPAPHEAPLVGEMRTPNADRMHFIMRSAIELGPIVRFEFPVMTAHLLVSPEYVEELLVTKQKSFSKRTRGYRKLAEFLGQGLLTSNGDFWKRQRRIANPAFHKKRIEGFADVMLDETDRLVDALREDKPFDMAKEMMRLTLRIAGRTLLSVDPSSDEDEVGRAVTIALHEANQRITNVLHLPASIPTARNRAFAQAARDLDRVVLGMIDDRRRSLARGGATPDDFLQMLLEAVDGETGERMSDAELRDEVMTMFLAGHETTANGLAWTFALLGQYPAVQRALRQELDAAFGRERPTAQTIGKVDLLRRVVLESMRLYPPVWLVARRAEEDVTIGGYVMPKDSLVFVSPWVTHRHPSYWEDPEVFDPDRFLPANEAKRHRYAHYPFIAGPRMCIGAGFALLELELVVARLLQRYRVSLEPGTPLVADPLITLRPRDGVMIRLKRDSLG